MLQVRVLVGSTLAEAVFGPKNGVHLRVDFESCSFAAALDGRTTLETISRSGSRSRGETISIAEDLFVAGVIGISPSHQADAHAIYDALVRGEAIEAAASPPTEVACWAHARRYFWEPVIGHHAAGKEGLLRSPY